MAKASKYKINNPEEAKKYKKGETIRVGKTLYLVEGVKPRGGVSDTSKKKANDNKNTAADKYTNIPAGFDRTGLSPDQLSIADSIFKTVGATPTIDTSNLTQAEIEGFVQDATNALDPYFKKQQTNIKQDFEDERTRVKTDITRSLEDLGITDKNLKEDISQNITRLGEDKLVAQGKIDRGFIEDVRNRQDNLEAQGLTFSGEAIKQIGDKSAFQTTIQGESQINKAESENALNTSYTRSIADLNSQLARKGSVLSGVDMKNLTPEQLASISQSSSDIDRAIARAYQDRSSALGRLDTGERRSLDELSGTRAFELRSLVGDETNQQLNLGRRLPTNYASLIKFPDLT